MLLARVCCHVRADGARGGGGGCKECGPLLLWCRVGGGGQAKTTSPWTTCLAPFRTAASSRRPRSGSDACPVRSPTSKCFVCSSICLSACVPYAFMCLANNGKGCPTLLAHVACANAALASQGVGRACIIALPAPIPGSSIRDVGLQRSAAQPWCALLHVLAVVFFVCPQDDVIVTAVIGPGCCGCALPSTTAFAG
jgi:hypothetical protein